MIENDFDDTMDQLPPSLRNKVLDHLFPDPEEVVELQGIPSWPLHKNLLWIGLVVLSIIVGFVVAIIGIVLMVIPPIGLIVIGLAGAPLAFLVGWRLNNNPQKGANNGTQE
jgi:hypothetical protein